MSETFVRVQATYRGRLGVEVGIFVAVDHLRRAGRLTPAETERYLEIDDWFLEHLPHPPFYADGNTVGAVTWFREPVPPAMASRVLALRDLLTAHGVEHEEVRSSDPGVEIYRDDVQVGVVPHERGEPTAPSGVELAPTTAGSKRAVSVSPIRAVVLGTSEAVEVVREGLRRQGYVVLGPGDPLPHGLEEGQVLRVADEEGAGTAGPAPVVWNPVDGPAALVSALAARGVDARLGVAGPPT
ncbi:hypothetical protein [Nocardioides sp. GY 10127]|uniref:hypothetical protein n=1 Tax=Nocardioides sp. GY 10127 TaxID=2569762 RepID=UPI0010A7C5FC|nr:hypothetical protein [Nocardioides sp. GY 10127]TIC86600.1 hypothetical protein E8D37_01560 [Nocardioides sp. GY 10127]